MFSQTREHIVVGVAVMEHVAADGYEIVGTFNGNPLAMAAARAMLCDVVTPKRTSGSSHCAPARWPASSANFANFARFAEAVAS